MTAAWFVLAAIFVSIFGVFVWVHVREVVLDERREYEPERQIKVRQRPPLYDHERRGDFSGPRKFPMRVSDCGHTWGRTFDGLCQGCGLNYEEAHA